MIEPEENPEPDQPQMTDFLQADAQSIHAQLVRMRQSSAGEVAADEVSMQQSAAGRMSADKVTLQQSAAGFIKADHVSLNQASAGLVGTGELLSQESSTGFVRAEKASISGYTGAVVAGSADIQHALVGMVAGQNVHLDEARTVFLIARTVNGNVTTLMDKRSALTAGLVGGLFAGLMLLLGRMLFRRKS